jgi:hypothetical protein
MVKDGQLLAEFDKAYQGHPANEHLQIPSFLDLLILVCRM